MSKPVLVKPIIAIAKKQRVLLHMDVHAHFCSDEGSLSFSLVGTTPPWLVIGENTGVILGETPTVPHNMQYLVTVQASNPSGSVAESFLIKVTDENFMTSMTSLVLNLTRNKTNYGSLDHHLRTFEVLAYIFEYFRQSKYWAEFNGLIEEELSKMNVNVANRRERQVSFEDFKKVVVAKNPTIEKHLREKLGNDHLLAEAELTNEQFRNLYRQGSQPQGAHPIPVFNYLAAPSQHNWTHLKTMLHEAVEAVVERFELTQQKTQNQHQFRVPVPTPLPKDWPRNDE
jgi:hypothetical protein